MKLQAKHLNHLQDCGELRIAPDYEYRYEVIDPTDKSFRDVDFVRYQHPLSRNKCLLVRLNSDHSHLRIEEVIAELDPSEYK